jgi:hypothetical protein
LPKICGHQSSKPCHLGFSGVMSVAVSAMFLFKHHLLISPSYFLPFQSFQF